MQIGQAVMKFVTDNTLPTIKAGNVVALTLHNCTVKLIDGSEETWVAGEARKVRDYKIAAEISKLTGITKGSQQSTAPMGEISPEDIDDNGPAADYGKNNPSSE